MGEESSPKAEDKPFSVLERFRQLKKEKEQAPIPETTNNVSAQASTTVFQAISSSSTTVTNGRNRGKGSEGPDPNARSRKRILTEMHKAKTEKEVGITEFIREGEGFDVILKHRYTDFQVNEIDLDGKVIKLTSTDIPQESIESETLSTEENLSILPPEEWVRLRDIVDKELEEQIKVDVTDMEKDKRQMIHKAVKKRFGVHVYSNTIEEDGKKYMTIGHAKKGATDRRNCAWPKDRPEYLHFVLYKDNSETNETIILISKLTNIKPNRFEYAGTKDKRGITTQQVCARKATADRFARCRSLRGIAVGHFSYKNKGLRLGDLKGNRFKIALRNVKVSDGVLKEAIEQLKKTGFINYFGMQRFGQSGIVPSYEIGRAILNGAWEKATELVLKPRPGEACHADVMEARKIWWETKDPTAALKPLTRKDKSIEGKLLLGLKKFGPKAYSHAFDSLPIKSVSLYLHSYQSLIWNRVVSRRLRTFGLRVLPGDLVRVEDVAPSDVDNTEQENGAEEDEDRDEVEQDSRRKQHVRVLSAEEAAVVSVYDVVYPMPGYDITLPANDVASWYADEMEREGESMRMFSKLKHRYGVFATYRNIVALAEEVSWSTMQYSRPDEDLQQTDLQAIRGMPAPISKPDGPYKALLIEFNLKPSCYATMAIRELAKCDTTSHSQALISNQAREDDVALKRRKVETSARTVAEESSSKDQDPGDLERKKRDEENKMMMMEAIEDNCINKILEYI